MGHPGDGWSGRYGRGWDGGEDDTMAILGRVPETQSLELIHQKSAQLQLSGRAGVGRRLLVGLGVDADVAAEAVEQGVHENLR